MINLAQYKRKIPNRPKFHCFDFKSINDFLKVATIPASENDKYGDPTLEKFSSVTGTEKFTGTQNIEEAIELLKNGWDDGFEKIKLSDTNNVPVKTKTVYKNEYDVVGGNACVARYLQGVPTNMIRKVGYQQKTKIINIYKSIGYMASYSTNTIFKDAKITSQVINALESKGYRCNLYMVFCSSENKSSNINYGEVTSIRIKIKDAGQPLNLKKIAFPLSHPSMLRRLIFRVMELVNTTNFIRSRNYGYPLDNIYKSLFNLDDKMQKGKEEYSKCYKMEKNDVFLPVNMKDAESVLKVIGF